MVKDNFLSAIDLETPVYDSSESAISDVNDNPIVTNQSVGGYYKIKYSGEELDEWLDYVAALFEEDAIGVIDTHTNQIAALEDTVNALEYDLSTITATVECKHFIEITGNTGDEHTVGPRWRWMHPQPHRTLRRTQTRIQHSCHIPENTLQQRVCRPPQVQGKDIHILPAHHPRRVHTHGDERCEGVVLWRLVLVDDKIFRR